MTDSGGEVNLRCLYHSKLKLYIEEKCVCSMDVSQVKM